MPAIDKYILPWILMSRNSEAHIVDGTVPIVRGITVYIVYPCCWELELQQPSY